MCWGVRARLPGEFVRSVAKAVEQIYAVGAGLTARIATPQRGRAPAYNCCRWGLMCWSVRARLPGEFVRGVAIIVEQIYAARIATPRRGQAPAYNYSVF